MAVATNLNWLNSPIREIVCIPAKHSLATTMLTIWGNADSINVQKILWCCEELSLPFQRIDAGRHFGVVGTPEFLQLNPNGLVPTIDDNGFVVWESNSILRYLAARYGSDSLWPQDVKARANADRWLDWSNSTLWPTLVPLFRAYLRTEVSQRDALVIRTAHQESVEVLQILNAHLGQHTYVGGEAFTIGDIAVGCAVWRWVALPIERPALEHLQRWFDLLTSRPAYRNVVMQPLS